MSTTLEAQHKAWGVLISNTNLRGAHIANGLVQLLRVAPHLSTHSLQVGRGEPKQSVKLVTTTLKDTWPLWDLSKSPHALGLCVTKSKSLGVLNLTDENGGYTDIIRAITTHLEGVLSEPLTDHHLIASTLNADGRVYLKGGSDLSASSLRLAGYTSTHTLSPMHALTYLGALCATPKGLTSLIKLHTLFSDESDPHSTLAHLLQLGGWPHGYSIDEEILRNAPPFAMPEDTARWWRFSERASEMTARLLAWSAGGAKADLLTSLVELIGLLIASSLWGWAEVKVLLLSPIEIRRRDRSLIMVAQRSFASAGSKLDGRSREEGLLRQALPSDALKTLTRVTGWLTPLSAQGGARHHLGPGPKALTTLIRALITPGEELSWEQLRARAAELCIELGGARHAGDELTAGALYEASRLNQEALASLGLARHESDDVLRVDAGGDR